MIKLTATQEVTPYKWRIRTRIANRVASLAMKRGKSVDFIGYWQRHVAG